jgi:hypothetical protein
MLSAIEFQTVAPVRPNPLRSDVVCFVGYVARRFGQPLPPLVLAQLLESGWPERLAADRLDALWNLPVVVESWSAFDQLFAWDRRPLLPGSRRFCSSYLGAAVRSFFANGGRRAVVVRVGDPWPYLEMGRQEQGPQRLGAILPSLLPEPSASAGAPMLDRLAWRGIEHLHGLPEVSHLCLPDLADCCGADPVELDPPPAPAPLPEVFVECSSAAATESPSRDDAALRRVAVPCLDETGYAQWGSALAETARFLSCHRRDVLFVGHVPQSQPETKAGVPPVYALEDPHGFLVQAGIWRDRSRGSLGGASQGAEAPLPAESAFLQLVWPWLRGPRSRDLPSHLEPPDGLLAGLLARNALARGTHRSIAGSPVMGIAFLEPVPALGPGGDGPSSHLAERVCLIGPDPGGYRLLSDVTTSAQRAWRSGGVSRMMSSLWRAVRKAGESVAFEPNGPETWAQVRRRLNNLLSEWWVRGALGGGSSAEAFQVRCDRSTLSQADLDQGRIRAEVGVLPAGAVERITLVLALENGAAQLSAPEVQP